MALDLTAVQEFVQQVVEAIATALGIEVMVFDPARNIVAGTGVTKIEVGQRYNEHSLTGSILATGQSRVERNPGWSDGCKRCLRFETCPYLVVVGYPIKVGEDMLGSFCLVATDEQQKQRLLADEQNLLRFLEKACLLIGSAINERRVQDELSLLLKRYDNVVNSVHEGIIVTDETAKITHLNRSALELLGVEPKAILGQTIARVFPGFAFNVQDLVARRIMEAEIGYAKDGKRKRYFLATIMPILGEEGHEVRGATVSLRTLKEVQSYAAKVVDYYGKYSFHDIIGQAEKISQLKLKLQKVALTDSTILIRGESGTGKELFAHAIHVASYRKQGPLIAINCSAIPESLMESELFGYEEGAFTGAKRGGKPGKFEIAAGGTMFLDEIGDMPLYLQSKLLRVLETHAVERVGGIEPISTNVRIIAATNRNLEEMVERREFRGDLYYRLSVIPVYIPALRERKADIPVLIQYFLDKYSQIMSREVQCFDAKALDILVNYPWPGNVRELQNAIEYAISMSEAGQPIMTEHLPQRIIRAQDSIVIASHHWESATWASEIINPQEKMKNMEAEMISQALAKFGDSTTGKEQAAKYLGISLATLYRRLKHISSSSGTA